MYIWLFFVAYTANTIKTALSHTKRVWCSILYMRKISQCRNKNSMAVYLCSYYKIQWYLVCIECDTLRIFILEYLNKEKPDCSIGDRWQTMKPSRIQNILYYLGFRLYSDFCLPFILAMPFIFIVCTRFAYIVAWTSWIGRWWLLSCLFSLTLKLDNLFLLFDSVFVNGCFLMSDNQNIDVMRNSNVVMIVEFR